MASQSRLALTSLIGVLVTTICELPAGAVTQGIPLTNSDFSLPGPIGTKVVAFGETGIPFAPTDPVVTLSSGQLAGGTPGWTFTGGASGAGEEACPGLGCSTFGDGLPGDSGTEGGGNPGNELLLSTLDGRVYQTSSFNVVSIPATQKYLLNFDAHNVFTPTGTAHLQARLFYVDTGGSRQTIGTPPVASNLAGFQTYSVELVGGSAALTPAVGRPIGVEFDTVSREFDATVGESWAGVDNVILQIAGVIQGDFNGDGFVNVNDYVVLRDNLQEAHTFEFEGELTGDFFVDLNDFRAFKTIYDSLNGAGAFVAMVASTSVPEPSTLVLISLAATFLAGAARRRRTELRRTIPCLSVIAACCAFSCGTPATAELLYYDPFLIGSNPAAGEYTVGLMNPTAAIADGQNPTVGPTPFFTGPWQIRTTDGNAPNQQVVAQGLSFIGSPAAGGAVQPVQDLMTGDGNGRVGRYLATPWTAVTSGTYYISFLASFGTANNPNSVGADGQADLGFRTVEFWPEGGAVGVDAGRTEIGYNGFFSQFPAGQGDAQRIPATARLAFITPGPDLELSSDANDDTQLLTQTTFNQDAGATHLVVMKFVLSTTAASDSISVFLDPTSTVEPIIANAARTGLDFTLAAMSTITRFGTPGGIMPIFDELRVADTFTEVVPDFPLPGDTNGDDLVDMADYTNIIQHMNLVGAAVPNTPILHPDVTGDGRVSIADFRLWSDNRTDDGAGAVLQAGVPEPTTALLAFAAAVAWVASVGCRRRGGGRFNAPLKGKRFVGSCRDDDYVLEPVHASGTASVHRKLWDDESTTNVADYTKFRAMTGMYTTYMREHKNQPPANEQAFREWLNTKQDRLQQAGLTVDQMFVSPRNGQPLEWVYGRKPPTSPSGMTCIAYEKTPVGGKRLVLATRGMYEEMDESQFSKVFPKAPK